MIFSGKRFQIVAVKIMLNYPLRQIIGYADV